MVKTTTLKLNYLHLGDSLEFMRQMPDGCIDVVITDPPYSSGGLHASSRARPATEKYCKAWRGKAQTEFDHESKDQRSWTFWCMLWLTELRRMMKPNGLLLCFIDWRQLPSLTDTIQAADFLWQGVAVWDKTVGRCRPRMGGFRQQAEFIVWATAGELARQQLTLPGVLPLTLEHPKLHITAKPLELARQLVRLVPEGATIFDPFAGSGTFLVAAKERGVNWLGCECSPYYHDVATERLNGV